MYAWKAKCGGCGVHGISTGQIGGAAQKAGQLNKIGWTMLVADSNYS